MKVNPVGYRVLIRPDPVDTKSKGGVIIASAEMQKKEQSAQVIGTVVALGANCWDKFLPAWAKVGDRVLYQRYAGMRIPDGAGGFIEDLLLLQDLDITAVVTEEISNGG